MIDEIAGRRDLARIPIDEFVSELASRRPAPGGGAVAALHLGQAAALVAMVARFSTGERYAAHADVVHEVITKADSMRADALGLLSRDAEAFDGVKDAWSLSHTTPREAELRATAIAEALTAAAGPPAEVIRGACSILDLAERILAVANPTVLTDVAAATEAARAAAITARLNVEVNLKGIRDAAVRNELVDVLDRVSLLVGRAAAVEQSVRAGLTSPTDNR